MIVKMSFLLAGRLIIISGQKTRLTNRINDTFVKIMTFCQNNYLRFEMEFEN